MISASQSHPTHPDTDDIVDIAFEVSWVASEIAVDVFGMFFWSALVLIFVQAIA